MLPFEEAEGFDWDSGNVLKVWDKHKVLPSECEQVFANTTFGGRPDKNHSARENRHILFGKTNEGRLLTVVDTIRKGKIRVISPRPMSRKEREKYEQAIAANT